MFSLNSIAPTSSESTTDGTDSSSMSKGTERGRTISMSTEVSDPSMGFAAALPTSAGGVVSVVAVMDEVSSPLASRRGHVAAPGVAQAAGGHSNVRQRVVAVVPPVDFTLTSMTSSASENAADDSKEGIHHHHLGPATSAASVQARPPRQPSPQTRGRPPPKDARRVSAVNGAMNFSIRSANADDDFDDEEARPRREPVLQQSFLDMRMPSMHCAHASSAASALSPASLSETAFLLPPPTQQQLQRRAANSNDDASFPQSESELSQALVDEKEQ